MFKDTVSAYDRKALQWMFFGLTFMISWEIWIPMAIFQITNMPLTILAAAGPLIATLIVLYWGCTSEYRREFWNRTIDTRRIPWSGWLLLFLLYPFVYIISLLLSGQALDLATIGNTLFSPVIIGVVIFGIIGGPLIEEPGWRGMGLDLLGKRFNYITICLILGFLWALWHLPLYWVPVEQVARPARTSAEFWLVTILFNRFVGEISTTFVYVWLVNRYRRSILAAIVLHFMGNNTPFLLGHAATLNKYEPYVVLCLSILAVCCALHWWYTERRGHQSQTALPSREVGDRA